MELGSVARLQSSESTKDLKSGTGSMMNDSELADDSS